jgi:hypothetical protein
VMSDKQEVDYSDLIRRLEIKPSEFSWLKFLKSVLPVLAIGGHAVHSFPYHLGSRKIDHNRTWKFQGLWKNYRGFDEVKITGMSLLLKALDSFFFIFRDI